MARKKEEPRQRQDLKDIAWVKRWLDGAERNYKSHPSNWFRELIDEKYEHLAYLESIGDLKGPPEPTPEQVKQMEIDKAVASTRKLFTNWTPEEHRLFEGIFRAVCAREST